MEDLNLNGLKILLEEAISKQEFEKAGYIEWLINKKQNEEASYEMDRDTQIKFILEDFNFENVAIAMDSVDWIWIKRLKTSHDENGKSVINKMDITHPTADELRKTAYDLLKEVWDNSTDDERNARRGTGGLEARRDMVDGKRCLSLEFIFASWVMDYEAVINPNYS